MVKVTQQTIDFIISWEGWSPESYWDHKQYTIGYGTKGYEGQVIDKQSAQNALREDIERRAKALSEKLTFKPSANQATALLDAAFNLGSVPAQVISFCNAREFDKAADHLRLYCHASGKKIPALVRRREAECRLLVSEVSAMTGEPRVQYDRVYHVLPPNASIDDVVQLARETYEARETIGYSYDDAGVGDLENRTVVLHGAGHPENIKEWYTVHYPGVQVVERHIPIETPQPPIFTPTKALYGLHGSADGCWGNPILNDIQDIYKTARLECYKALSNESSMSIPIIKNINPDSFIMVRLFAKVNTDNPFSDDFIRSVSSDARSWYNNGVRYFEVHNEPNLQIEGMFDCWRDGSEFANWFHRVVHHLKADMPEAKFGYPGLSPGFAIEGVRYNCMRFWRESHIAWNKADWIGVHCYWQNEAEIRSTDGGHWFKHIQPDVSGKPMLITEFSNPSPHVSKEVKAHQYNNYIQSLDNNAIHSAYSFVATASSGFEHETWNDSPIPRIVGSRNYGQDTK